jgi:hypothetical protein
LAKLVPRLSATARCRDLEEYTEEQWQTLLDKPELVFARASPQVRGPLAAPCQLEMMMTDSHVLVPLSHLSG